MQYRAALGAALLPLASAFTVTITSNCEFDIYGWNVVDAYGSGSPSFTLTSGSSTSNTWSSPFQQKAGGGGPSIKLQKVNDLFVNAEQTQVEYDMAGNTMFYDLSDVNGHPFQGSSIVMQTSNPSCPTVNCAAGDSVCTQAYQMPDDVRTLACDGGANIEVLLCGASSSLGGSSSGSSGSSNSASSASAVAPSHSTSAPTKAVPTSKPTTLATSTAAKTSAASASSTANAAQQLDGGFLEESPAGGDVEVVVATKVVAVTSIVHVPRPSGDSNAKREAEAHLRAHLHRGHSRVMGRHAH